MAVTHGFTNPQTVHYLQEQSSTRVKGVEDTTRTQLRKQLANAYSNGEKPSQWKARIESVLDCDHPAGRAEMIARTELSWAYSRGLLSTYDEVGVQKVQWLAVMDNRTCEDCAGLNEEIMSLSDAEGKLPLHPRCRCTVVSADAG
jgi:SPP1 gp7 family putative phage head morphogenesis protein